MHADNSFRLLHADAIDVIEIEDVLVAIIHSYLKQDFQFFETYLFLYC